MKQEREYRICKRCVMDTTDPDIIFDENGYCNHCNDAQIYLNKRYVNRKKNYNTIINELKTNKKYDCIVGISGGVDSSYVLHLLKTSGINPLALHIDNGWNSELSVKNINNLVTNLDIDLITYVIDWEEFRDLQLAYLKASVVDIEVLSDNPINVLMHKYAKKFKLNSIVYGTNITSESIMPKKWYYQNKNDALNIRSIYRKFGSKRKLKTYPMWNIFQFFLTQRKIKHISILNYVDYDKEEAKKLLKTEYGWKEYGGKHGESFFTKFYQDYILIEKFGIDKRRAHLSSLIVSKQKDRNEALKILENKTYTDVNKLNDDINYFIKKIKISQKEFSDIIKAKRREHLEFSSYTKFSKAIKKFIGLK